MGRFTLNFVDLTTVSVKTVETLVSPCPQCWSKRFAKSTATNEIGERGDERERKKQRSSGSVPTIFLETFAIQNKDGRIHG